MYSFCSLDVYDEATGQVLHEVYLDEFKADELPEVIRDSIISLKDNEWVPLEPAITTHAMRSIEDLAEWTNMPMRLRHESSELPYRIHGGREYDLMAKKKKPLAVFSFISDSSPMNGFLQKYFEPLARCGTLVAETIVEDEGHNTPTSNTYIYALPNEAWRIQAYRLVMSTAKVYKWNDTLERMEGDLLGYTKEQSDLWSEYRRRNGIRWGLQLMYSFIRREDAVILQRVGYRVLLPTSIDSATTLYLPYHGSGADDQELALAPSPGMKLVRLYVPLVKFVQFSRGVREIGGIKFEVLEVPSSALQTLNQAIDGEIEIVTGEPGSRNLPQFL